MKSLTEIGPQLRERRAKEKLTQAQLAVSAGVALRTLVRIEAGDPSVKLGTVERTARALGMKLGVLAVEQRRPTLDDLAALYPDDESDAAPRATRARR